MKLKLPDKLSRDTYKKARTVIPFLFTYLNAIFGFLSILKALDDEYIAAACYILLAALMDSIDGRLARAFNSVSYVGMELDSLCDAISFCLAPIVLVHCWFPGFVGFGSHIALVFYLCAGLYRLARFNSSPEKQHYFVGLPTPIAAVLISSIIVSHQWLAAHALRLMLYKSVLFPLIMCIALLMISPIKFYSLKVVRIKRIRDCVLLLILGALLILSAVHGFPLLLLVMASYVLGHLVLSIVHVLTEH